jgi:hypothetical protein
MNRSMIKWGLSKFKKFLGFKQSVALEAPALDSCRIIPQHVTNEKVAKGSIQYHYTYKTVTYDLERRELGSEVETARAIVD